MLNVGDFAFDKTAGTSVQVLEKIDVWGYVSYKVFNPATGRVYKVNEEQLNTEKSEVSYDENYLRYVTLLSKIKNETAGGLLSSLSSGIIPLPHQLHVLNRADVHKQHPLYSGGRGWPRKNYRGWDDHQGTESKRTGQADACGLSDRSCNTVGFRNAGEVP
jgi:hypothetical protein